MTAVTVTLYTKSGCHLCADVKAELTTLQAIYPHQVQEVDITQDDDLFRRYRFRIPVLRVGTAVLFAPIDRAQLMAALAIATQTP